MYCNDFDERIVKYVPKYKKAAIRYAERDNNGYWIRVCSGWTASRSSYNKRRVIHAKNIKELRYQIAGICRCAS